jgi:hypothetical protein
MHLRCNHFIMYCLTSKVFTIRFFLYFIFCFDKMVTKPIILLVVQYLHRFYSQSTSKSKPCLNTARLVMHVALNVYNAEMDFAVLQKKKGIVWMHYFTSNSQNCSFSLFCLHFLIYMMLTIDRERR